MDECCEAMAEVLAKSDGPFYHPVRFIDGELKADQLAVKVYRLTPSKKSIARKGRMTVFLAYCPFCGKAMD